MLTLMRGRPVPHLGEIRHKLPQDDSLPDFGHDVKITLQIVPGRERGEKDLARLK
jgi:hypothetical protein